LPAFVTLILTSLVVVGMLAKDLLRMAIACDAPPKTLGDGGTAIPLRPQRVLAGRMQNGAPTSRMHIARERVHIISPIENA
jgi:hypothetical protein